MVAEYVVEEVVLTQLYARVGVAYFRINELEKASSYVLPAAQALEEQLGVHEC